MVELMRERQTATKMWKEQEPYSERCKTIDLHATQVARGLDGFLGCVAVDKVAVGSQDVGLRTGPLDVVAVGRCEGDGGGNGEQGKTERSGHGGE